MSTATEQAEAASARAVKLHPRALSPVSVVCPFYNEAAILEASVRRMLGNLAALSVDWELVIVDDGSTDESLRIARSLERQNSRLRVLSYPQNRGRGHAIRIGVAAATHEIVVTTEIDGSWGDAIVPNILEAFRANPLADIIIGSTHLPGGGYRNVPWDRVALSVLGNWIIRSGLTYQVTMNTGMTRGYRRKRFLALPLDEDGKEMHLEIINKALAFGYQIREIPAVLEWPEQRRRRARAAGGAKRSSPNTINRLIRTHMLFSIVTAPFRYLYAVSLVLGVACAGLFAGAIVNLFRPEPSIFLFLSSLLLGLIGFVIFGIGVLAQQGRMLQRELWHIRYALQSPGKPDQPE